MIDVQNMSKYYGTHAALRDISFQVDAGETVGFLGVNGAGKSTTMRILTGFLPATTGTIRIAGLDINTQAQEARRHFGYLPESTPLYRDMRVQEFLTYRAKLKGVPRKERAAHIDSVLARCQVDNVRGRIIGQLSKGYRQRVGLADCLLNNPPLLILDEPTVGLDPNQVVETRALIKKLGEERTIFLSSHILHEIELLCRKVIIINDGVIVAEGSPEELYAKHAPVRSLTVQLCSAEDAAPLLKTIEGVSEVTPLDAPEDGIRAYLCRHAATTDPRRAIAQAVTEKGWPLQEMRIEPMRLEEIFTRLTTTAREEDAA